MWLAKAVVLIGRERNILSFPYKVVVMHKSLTDTTLGNSVLEEKVTMAMVKNSLFNEEIRRKDFRGGQ